MRSLLFISFLCTSTALAQAPQSSPAAARPQALPDINDRDAGWPRRVQDDALTLVVYQPQVESWDEVTLKMRAAVSVESAGAKAPMWGTVYVKARTQVDKPAGLVHLEDVQLTGATFPGAPAEAKPVLEALRKGISAGTRTIALARLTAGRPPAESKPSSSSGELAAPEFIFHPAAAVLIRVDGEPRLQPVPNTKYQRVVNTTSLILRDEQAQRFLLAALSQWYAASAIEGPWTSATDVPAELVAAEQRLVAQRLVDSIEAPKGAAPGSIQVFVRTKPTVLVCTDGEPNWVAVGASGLETIEDSDGAVFREASSKTCYALLAGRWFRAASLAGPWSFVPHAELPAAFAKIPSDSPQSVVREFVPGTPEAQEALNHQNVPQTASVPRKNLQANVIYDGDPKFEPLEGTSLRFAPNASYPVIQAKPGSFFTVVDGVWFTAEGATGPWSVATSVPAEIYAIPETSPLYFVTFVKVYESNESEVKVGYTPGYLGCQSTQSGVVVHDTSWLYRVPQGQMDKPTPWNYGPQFVGDRTRWGPVGGWGWGGNRGWNGYGWQNRYAVRDVTNNYNVYDRWKGSMGVTQAPPAQAVRAPQSTTAQGANDVIAGADGRLYRSTPQGLQVYDGQTWRRAEGMSAADAAAIEREDRARAAAEMQLQSAQQRATRQSSPPQNTPEQQP